MITKSILKGVRYKHEEDYYEVVEPWVKVKMFDFHETAIWRQGVMYKRVDETGTMVGEPLVRDRASFIRMFEEL